jgi:histidinol-phosphate aminotransferase
MIDINKFVRKNILALTPYSSARKEYKGTEGIFLDANENPFGNLNRYPDPLQNKLKQKLSEQKNIDTKNIFIGNGSDEVIDLAIRIFCEPEKDKILTFTPTYGMYEISAAINNVVCLNLPLDEAFQINFDSLENYYTDKNIKIIFICNPNNPTGNSILNIEKIIEKFKGIIFLDEAYIDFSNQTSLLQKLDTYPNLIISQTFSKAWGLAAARIGIAYASEAIINLYNKVKPPYNISSLNEQAAINALDNKVNYESQKQEILLERNKLIQNLQKISAVKNIFPTETNFILIEVGDATEIYNKLIAEKLVIRNRHSIIKNCLRITVGTKLENEKLIHTLKSFA